jgi:hypothetical protein
MEYRSWVIRNFSHYLFIFDKIGTESTYFIEGRYIDGLDSIF